MIAARCGRSCFESLSDLSPNRRNFQLANPSAIYFAALSIDCLLSEQLASPAMAVIRRGLTSAVIVVIIVADHLLDIHRHFSQ